MYYNLIIIISLTFPDSGEGAFLVSSEGEGNGGKTIGGVLMSVIYMKQLLEAGVHFGHQTRRWNPKMAPYIYTERKGIYIIDLKQTLGFFEKAYDVVRDVASKGGTVLFVGTKKQAQEVIEREALRCGMPYVNHRWVGGLLTNFPTIRGRVERLKELRELFESDDIHNYTKKELAKISKEKEKLEKYFKGIVNMEEQPDLMVVIDINKEENAVHEANIKNIPVVALVDTNCDPIPIDYIIPGNDDAIKAITLVVSKLADAVIEGREGYSEATGEVENADVSEEISEKENKNNENEETEIVEEEL